MRFVSPGERKNERSNSAIQVADRLLVLKYARDRFSARQKGSPGFNVCLFISFLETFCFCSPSLNKQPPSLTYPTCRPLVSDSASFSTTHDSHSAGMPPPLSDDNSMEHAASRAQAQMPRQRNPRISLSVCGIVRLASRRSISGM